MQSVSSRVWTRVAVSISYDDNHYTTGTKYIYIYIMRAILNRSWRQHPTKQQLYGYLSLITKTIEIRRTRQTGHSWRSRDELISDVLPWTSSHGRAKAGWPAQTYIQQLCEDTECSPEDLPEAMNNRERCRERVRDIHADDTTRWWWYINTCLYVRVCPCVWERERERERETEMVDSGRIHQTIWWGVSEA